MDLIGTKFRAKAWYRDEQWGYHVIEFISETEVFTNYRTEADENITDRLRVAWKAGEGNTLSVTIDNRMYKGEKTENLITFTGLPLYYRLY